MLWTYLNCTCVGIFNWKEGIYSDATIWNTCLLALVQLQATLLHISLKKQTKKQKKQRPHTEILFTATSWSHSPGKEQTETNKPLLRVWVKYKHIKNISTKITKRASPLWDVQLCTTLSVIRPNEKGYQLFLLSLCAISVCGYCRIFFFFLWARQFACFQKLPTVRANMIGLVHNINPSIHGYNLNKYDLTVRHYFICYKAWCVLKVKQRDEWTHEQIK